MKYLARVERLAGAEQLAGEGRASACRRRSRWCRAGPAPARRTARRSSGSAGAARASPRRCGSGSRARSTPSFGAGTGPPRAPAPSGAEPRPWPHATTLSGSYRNLHSLESMPCLGVRASRSPAILLPRRCVNDPLTRNSGIPVRDILRDEGGDYVALGLGAAVLAMAAGVHAGPARADRYAHMARWPATTGAELLYRRSCRRGRFPRPVVLPGTLTLPEQSHAFAGGAQLGLQKQWGRLVLGAEAAYTWTDLEETSASGAAGEHLARRATPPTSCS